MWKLGLWAGGWLLNCIRNEKCLPPHFSLFLSPNCIVIVKAFTLQLAWTKQAQSLQAFSAMIATVLAGVDKGLD